MCVGVGVGVWVCGVCVCVCVWVGGGTVDGGVVLECHPKVEPHEGHEHREKHDVQANGAHEQHRVERAGQPP